MHALLPLLYVRHLLTDGTCMHAGLPSLSVYCPLTPHTCCPSAVFGGYEFYDHMPSCRMLSLKRMAAWAGRLVRGWEPGGRDTVWAGRLMREGRRARGVGERGGVIPGKLQGEVFCGCAVMRSAFLPSP